MLENPILILGLSILAASIPAGIWLYFLFKKAEKSKKTLFLIFFLGCFTAPALLGIQELWSIFPNFDLANFIEKSISTPKLMYVAMFILFAALEEIIKMYVVVQVDKRTLLINKINDALKYSMASALGFSFVENIYYLYQFWPIISTGELVGMYIFRSGFTTCAHLIFSGIFGYYYGVSKFAIDISKQKEITEKHGPGTRLIAYIFDLPMSHAFQQKLIFIGLTTAILIHAVYNYMLQFNVVLPAIIFIVSGFGYILFLLKRKAGHLIFSTDITEKSKLRMGQRDEEVVIELLAMWSKEKRYVDVVHICERLLERDPDNNVVKLFKAKALDAMEDGNVYKKILSTVVKDKDEISAKDNSVIAKYVEEKEKLKLSNKEKELKNKQQEEPKEKKKLLEDYTGDGTFNMKL